MACNPKKISLVSYRRNSSDMELSTSEEDVESAAENYNEKFKQNALDKDNFSDVKNGDRHAGLNIVLDKEKLSYSSQGISDERWAENERRNSKSENRREDSRKDRSSSEKYRRDSRKSDHDRKRSDDYDKRRHRKDRSITPEKKIRKSLERSHGRSPTNHRHRSRSPGRSKHLPDRREHRKRSHSPERRPYHSRTRSPEMTFRSRRLEKKAARIDRLGLELIAEPKPGVRPFLDGFAKEGVTSTGGVGPNYFNPGATNSSRIAEQIQKRRMLWGSNKKDPTTEQPCDQASSSGTGKTWEAATFKGDNNGKMTEKFKRLMGIKGESGTTAGVADSGDSIIQKQEEMFSNMEAQYQVARMATHTHRGIGLGFGTFQVPPR